MLFEVAMLLAATSGATHAEMLIGTLHKSTDAGSGWVNLQKPIDLRKGDRLRVQVGGAAAKILVRVLEDLNAADEPVGIEGGVRDVPADRTVEVAIAADHPATKQISVHGGARAWSVPLGKDNGPATIESVELLGAPQPMP
jgi:hypothetical protein